MEQLAERVQAIIRDKGGIGKFIRYAAVGISAVAVDFLIFKLMLIILGGGAIDIFGISIYSEKLANTAAVFGGFIYSFILNRSWTFESKGNALGQVVMLLLLLCVNTFVSSEAISFLGRRTPVGFELAKLCAQAVTACWNYIIYDKIIYRS